jgi:DNA gyrase subunit A
VRARTVVEKTLGKSEREQIVLTEIPYQVNKARLTKRIAELARDKEIEGIAEVRDESDREGIRLVIELKKDVFPQVVLNQLYRLTDMQVTFGVINLSVVEGRPAVLTLRETLSHFIAHRKEVVTRRSRHELRQAEAQRELVLGLGLCTTDIDLVINTIRQSPDQDTARERLMALPLHGLEEFVRRAGRPEAEIAEAKAKGAVRLSERQAKAILDMRLARLTGLERERLAREYGELSDEVARLQAILADVKLLLAVIVRELEDVKARYAEPRRTEIVAAEAEINAEDLIQEQEMVVTVSHSGYIKRTPLSEYQAQKRGGRGKIGHGGRDEDFVSRLFVASTHAYVFIFSERGKVYVKKVYEIPEAARNAKGRAIVNFVGLEAGERVAAVAPVREFSDNAYIVTLTKRGLIKKTSVTAYENYREKGIIGVKLDEGDELLSAELTDGTREFLIATRQGMSIRFPEEQVRPTGRDTMGVKAVTLDEGDHVVGFAVTEPGRDRVLALCENGYGKRTPLEEFRVQNRGGKGIILIDASERNGPVAGCALVREDDQVMVMTDRGVTLRTAVREIRETGRNAQGVRVMAVGEGERIIGFERLEESDDEAQNGAATDSTPPASAEATPPSTIDGAAGVVDGATDDGPGGPAVEADDGGEPGPAEA